MLKKWILMHFTKYCSNKESWFGLMCTHLICYHNDLWTINKKWQFFKDESVSETCILLIVSRIDSMNFLLRDIKCERNGPLMHLTKYSTIKESWFGLMNTHSVFYYAHFFFFAVVLGKSHYLLYHLVAAMQPRMLVTFDEELRPLPVAVRVGQVGVLLTHCLYSREWMKYYLGFYNSSLSFLLWLKSLVYTSVYILPQRKVEFRYDLSCLGATLKSKPKLHWNISF